MFATVLSWAGALLVLIAFALNIRKVITPESLIYIILNIFGALFLAYAAFLTKGYAFTFLNSVWALFAIYSLFQIKSNKA